MSGPTRLARSRGPLIIATLVGLLGVGWYRVEPWTLTFIDDGPYFSEGLADAPENLPTQSEAELRRFGFLMYRLQSRLALDQQSSVLVLEDPDGAIHWSIMLIKPDGPLGPITLREARTTWTGGWRVAINPAHQEPGSLYLGPFGGFRFFNHSW